MENREKIIQKIRKCLALADSSFQSEAESAVITAKRLMARYKIEEGELQAEESGDIVEEVIGTTSKYWHHLLLKYLSKEFGCSSKQRIIGDKRKSELVVVGTIDDIAFVKEVYLFVVAYAKKEVAKGIRENKERGLPYKGYDRNFGLGFVDGLKKRFEEDKKTYTGGYQIIVQNTKRAEAYNLGQEGTHEVKINVGQNNLFAAEHGYLTGKNLDLSEKTFKRQ